MSSFQQTSNASSQSSSSINNLQTTQVSPNFPTFTTMVTPPTGSSLPHNPISASSLDQQDDESIHSTSIKSHITTTPSFIKPVFNYSKYGVWLRNNFPNIITIKDSFFVHNILKIRTLEDVLLFQDFTPDDWKDYIPKSYHVWAKTIIELVIIWSVTLDVFHDVPFSEYMETRQEMLPMLEELYEISMPKSPTPPPYQPVSPTLQEFKKEKEKSLKNQNL